MRPYDFGYLIRTLALITMLMLACMVSDGIAVAIAIPFSVFALISNKPEKVFFWAMFLMASIVINPFFLPKGSAYGVIQRGLLVLIGFSGVFRLAGSRKNAVIGALLWMMAYIAYMIIPSATGWWPMVSFLKLGLFILIFLALVSMTNTVLVNENVDSRRIRSVFLAFCILFIFGSLALLPFPSIGQLSGEEYQLALMAGKAPKSLFKGMANQSQALGPVVTMIGALLLADLMFGIKKFDALYVSLFLCVPYLIYSTSSRTAMASFILAVGFMLYHFVKARNIAASWRTKILSMALLLGTIGSVVVVCSSGFRDSIAQYALKTDGGAKAGDVSWEAATSSRQGLMDEALMDFKRKPVFGNGFQVEEKLLYRMGGSKGLLLSAPVEKGVWITAVLQEGGTVGFVLYCAFLIFVLMKMSERKYYVSLTMFVLFHILNLGEFTLFSMSGLGGFMWTLVFVALIIDESRIRLLKRTSDGWLL